MKYRHLDCATGLLFIVGFVYVYPCLSLSFAAICKRQIIFYSRFIAPNPRACGVMPAYDSISNTRFLNARFGGKLKQLISSRRTYTIYYLCVIEPINCNIALIKSIQKSLVTLFSTIRDTFYYGKSTK